MVFLIFEIFQDTEETLELFHKTYVKLRPSVGRHHPKNWLKLGHCPNLQDPPPPVGLGYLSRWFFWVDFFIDFLDELGHCEHNTLLGGHGHLYTWLCPFVLAKLGFETICIHIILLFHFEGLGTECKALKILLGWLPTPSTTDFGLFAPPPHPTNKNGGWTIF